MTSKSKLFSRCGVCCPRRKCSRLVLTAVIPWSFFVFTFFILFLRPRGLPTAESNYDTARIQSEILRENLLTGMNIKNACTLCQPFPYDIGKRKLIFDFRFPLSCHIGKRNLIFHLRFSFSYIHSDSSCVLSHLALNLK